MFVSPFSTHHDWKVGWKRERGMPRDIDIPRTYYPVLYAVATIGCAGSVQLKNLFGLYNKKKLKSLAGSYLLLKHELFQGDKRIPVYTLGTNGVREFHLPHNYWLNWQAEDVLKRLVFFKLYEVFLDYEPDIVPSPEPFVGALQIGHKLYHVFVARDDVYDLLLYMKWNQNPDQRIIIVTEKLEHLSPLNPFLNDVKIRVTTDEDLLNEESIDQMFYEWDAGDNVWVKNESIYQK